MISFFRGSGQRPPNIAITIPLANKAPRSGAKGLNDVVKLHTVRFIPALFDRGHVMAGRCRETPLRRCEDLPFRLISVENIRNGLG